MQLPKMTIVPVNLIVFACVQHVYCTPIIIVSGSHLLSGDRLLTLNDLDPLGLRLPHQARNIGMARHLGFRAPGHDTIVQVALISETTRLLL